MIKKEIRVNKQRCMTLIVRFTGAQGYKSANDHRRDLFMTIMTSSSWRTRLQLSFMNACVRGRNRSSSYLHELLHYFDVHTVHLVSCAVVMKSGNLNFLEPSGPLQACNGTALPLSLPCTLFVQN